MSEKKEEKKRENKVDVEDLETEGEDVKGGANALRKAAIKKEQSSLRLNRERLDETVKR